MIVDITVVERDCNRRPPAVPLISPLQGLGERNDVTVRAQPANVLLKQFWRRAGEMIGRMDRVIAQHDHTLVCVRRLCGQVCKKRLCYPADVQGVAIS